MEALQTGADRIAADVVATTGRETLLIVEPSDRDWVKVGLLLAGHEFGPMLCQVDDDVESFVAELADTLRESYLDEEIWGGWPICPDHNHPLDPGLDEARVATWFCSRTRPVARIGALDSSTAP